MFTGLIEEIGRVRLLQRTGQAIIFTIEATNICSDLKIGDSVALNGVCLTATSTSADCFTVQAVEETMSRTALGLLAAGSPVNLERALRLSDRLGGHLVAGHVDTTAVVETINALENSWLFTFRLAPNWMRYVIEKGSIAINGVSLTVADMTLDTFTIAVIPETWRKTTFPALRVGQAVNIEVDLVGKYVEKFVQPAPKNSLTLERLQALGY